MVEAVIGSVKLPDFALSTATAKGTRTAVRRVVKVYGCLYPTGASRARD